MPDRTFHNELEIAIYFSNFLDFFFLPKVPKISETYGDISYSVHVPLNGIDYIRRLSANGIL